jgi:hypothetical protein
MQQLQDPAGLKHQLSHPEVAIFEVHGIVGL